ncbi:MAG: hypothetical protein C0602_12380 [Denitrovibrio sp.]|nr:MAG: hypothetical protein C0602_12380 [Denitrovibrio sp.]
MYKLLAAISLFIFAITVFASSNTSGIIFQDTFQSESSELRLNGAGLRKKFVIKVYAAGLYLVQKETDEHKIIETDEPMTIRMVMIYNGISPEKMKETWTEGFQANTPDIQPLQERINTLTSWFTEEAKSGDIYDISYEPGKGTSLIINGERRGTVKGLDFKKSLFSVWLGERPADKKLKEAMLGR